MQRHAARAHRLVSGCTVVLVDRRDRLVQFAADKRLPAIYYGASWADAGGLMFYGPNTNEVGRQVASYIDKIFKGAKPGDLPVVPSTTQPRPPDRA